ncbi:MAG: hypothetical protein JXR48_04395 [Candidatus Delongbacteria bacterium]|nr:hypothetical protein [Candidatus Delongbacteria bacterium]
MKSKKNYWILIGLIVCIFVMCKNTNNHDRYKLIGIWGTNKENNASFKISQDSIYYPEYFKSFAYTLKKDSIIIHFDDWDYRGVFFFRNDSLIMKSDSKEASFIQIMN